MSEKFLYSENTDGQPVTAVLFGTGSISEFDGSACRASFRGLTLLSEACGASLTACQNPKAVPAGIFRRGCI